MLPSGNCVKDHEAVTFHISSALEILGCHQVKGCFSSGGTQTLPSVCQSWLQRSVPESGGSLLIAVLRGAGWMRKKHISSQAPRSKTLQKSLGFYPTRNIPPPGGAAKQVPPCVGLCWCFSLFLFNNNNNKKSPWVLHIRYQAGKQT